MKLPVATLTFVLLFQTACSLNLKTFGAKSTGDDITNINVKGSFPLGEPMFTGFEKYSLSVMSSNELVFLDNFDEIHVVSSDGIQLRKFTPAGLDDALAIATDSTGNIYVSGYETSNGDSLILKYSKMGTNRQEIGRFPAWDTGGGVYGSVQLYDLKVGSDNSIYIHILENITNRIEKYSSAGTHLQTFTIPNGTSDGQANGLQSFIPNSDGSLYIVDYHTNRIQKLKADGSFDSKITWARHEATSFIENFLQNPDGSFVLVEKDTDVVIHKIDSTGATIWKKDGTETGTAFNAGLNPSLAKFDNKYYFTQQNVLHIYSETGGLLNSFTKVMTSPSAVVRASDGSFFVGDANGIIKYSASGIQQNSFASPITMRTMAISANDVIYSVNLLTGGTISKFDINGNPLGTFASTAAAGYGMCVDKENNVYISDASGIKKIAADETTITTVKAGIFSGLHCNSDGTFFALYYDGAQMVAQKLDASGNVILTFDHSGAGAIGITYGLSVSGDNAVIADNQTNKVLVFNANTGAYVRQFGNTGIDALMAPIGILIDQFNEIFVADKDNHFVKKYSVTGTMLYE